MFQTDRSPKMPERVTLSICIPTYHRARYLACLLQDLAKQLPELGFSYELLIGDNASPDETADVVRSYEGQLNIRYFRRNQNIGGDANLSLLYEEAVGDYLVYLADDDFLIIDAVRECVHSLEAAPELGAVFAPWFIHDRIDGKDVTQFYALDSEVRIDAGSHCELFILLLNKHIFPEIYIIRTSIAKSMITPQSRFAFAFFPRIAGILDRSAVLFSKRPFYRSVSRYFEDEVRIQAGNEQVKDGWDCYRGGLEYIYAKFSEQLSEEDRRICRRGIDQFVDIRMQVGLRLRTAEGKFWIDNYYIANRLISNGRRDMLPAPYDQYRVNAAMEYLLELKPFAAAAARFAYFQDDSPIVLTMAHGFAQANFDVIQDRETPIEKNTILVTTRRAFPVPEGVVSVSEPDLLARFP
jgi:glycosyltransferase involved in cell wall biosynthesis